MAAAAQQILTALQALLAAGGTVAGTRVYVDTVDPLQPAQLPAIVLEEDPGGEQSEPFTVHGYDKRALGVTVHCVISHSTTAAADARSFGLAVEKLIANSATLAALCSQGHRITANRPAINGDFDQLLAERVQSWSFGYIVAVTAPDIFI